MGQPFFKLKRSLGIHQQRHDMHKLHHAAPLRRRLLRDRAACSKQRCSAGWKRFV